MLDTTNPVEPVSTELQEPAALTVPSVSPAASGDPSAAEAEAKRLRDRLAQEAREKKALERAMLAQASTIQALSAQVASIGAEFSQQKQAQVDAYIRSLPPEQQALKKIELLEQQLKAPRQTAAPQPQPVPQVPSYQESPTDYQERRTREILGEIRTQFGVELSEDDEALDTESEQAFIASARAIARERKRNGVVATAPQPTPAAPQGVKEVAKESSGVDEAKLTEKITKQVMKDLGVDLPINPRATGAIGDGRGATASDLAEINRGYSSRSGPRGNVAALKAARDKLEANLNKGRS